MKQRPFIALWALAVAATVAAFVLHLAMRGKTVDLGYRLGRARADQAHLREVKRVLSLEAASYETPQRVEVVARTLLGMTPPPAERVIVVRNFVASKDPDESGPSATEETANVPPGRRDAGAPSSGAPSSGAPSSGAPSSGAPSPAEARP